MTPQRFAELFRTHDDPRDLWENEEAREVLLELGRVCNFNEDGKHFTQFLRYWQHLEEAGLVEIHRPEHEQTGIRYSQEFWSISVTGPGRDVLETLMDAGLLA